MKISDIDRPFLVLEILEAKSMGAAEDALERVLKLAILGDCERCNGTGEYSETEYTHRGVPVRTIYGCDCGAAT